MPEMVFTVCEKVFYFLPDNFYYLRRKSLL